MSVKEKRNGNLMDYNFDKLFKNPLDLDFENPFICSLVEFIEYDEDNNQVMCIVKDDTDRNILGFFYKKFAELLREPTVQSRIPFKITVVRGKIEKLGDSLVFEIYQAIFEKNSLINSSSMSEYSFCPVGTYLTTHIRAEGNLNPNLLFGVLFHDYLGIVFDDNDLLKLSPLDPSISSKVLTSYQDAIYRNWELLTATGIDESKIFCAFIKHYSNNEISFINYELQKLTGKFDEWRFQTEKMMRSKNLGLQGRIDRLLWNHSNNSFTIYETKTGKSSASSEESAKYQLISYSVILQEYFLKKLEELILEYPRNELKNRLKIIDYDEDILYKLISMRNDIWAIGIGKRPELGPYLHCGNCWSKDICSFYCLRSFLTKYCGSCSKCKYFEIVSNKKSFEEFRRLNIYYDWFSKFLESEYLANLSTRAEFSLKAREREDLGNCLADLIIKEDNIIYEGEKEDSKTKAKTKTKTPSEIFSQKKFIEFSKNLNSKVSDTQTIKEDFSGTRLNRGDFILVTPQHYQPLTVQSFYGVINSILKDKVMVEISTDSYKEILAYPKETVFRIDSTVSNIMLNLQRTALDKFMRKPYNLLNDNLNNLRKLILNFNQESEDKKNQNRNKIQISESELNSINKELKGGNFNEEQIEAIIKSLQFSGILLIHGPPGTGKTTTIAEIVFQLSKYISKDLQITSEFQNTKLKDQRGSLNEKFENPRRNTKEIDHKMADYDFDNLIVKKKILISAFTNRAVDTIIKAVQKSHPELDIVRIGTETSISPDILPISLQYRSKKHKKFRDGQIHTVNSPRLARIILEESDVIATTCLGAGSTLLTNFNFEYVIIDETGQIVEPAALIPILKGNNVILVGDDKQLPPISQKINNHEFNDYFFEKRPYLNKFESISEESLSIQEQKEIFNGELKNLKLKTTDTLSTSIFQRLSRNYGNTDRFIAFSKQYRMNKIISDFASKFFYDGKLIPGKTGLVNIGDKTLKDFFDSLKISYYDDVSEEIIIKSASNFEETVSFAFDYRKPMIFLDTSELNAYDSKLDDEFDELSSRFNIIEANFVSELVFKFIINIYSQLNVHNTEDFQNNFIFFLKNIGVITPYRAQVRAIRENLFKKFADDKNIQELVTKEVIVDTVDKFQGNEAEIILISLVDSNPNGEISKLLEDIRRLNVSITRAKTKLIIIGNSEMFRVPKKKQSNLSDYIKKKNIKKVHDPKFQQCSIKEILSSFINSTKKRMSYLKL
ncbi:MAG: AAA domain-containing protein [Promethearchaeota archaeon]